MFQPVKHERKKKNTLQFEEEYFISDIKRKKLIPKIS